MKSSTIGGIAIALIFAMTGFLFPSQAVAEADIKKNLWSTTPYFNLIRPTKAPLDQFSFFINGQPGDKTMVEAVKHKDSLHVRFRLTYGEQNNIELRENSSVIYSADVFYAPSYESGIVPEESTYSPFHTLTNEARCQGCHRFKILPTDLDPGKNTQNQICFPCHNHDFEGKKSQHKPAAIEWRCLKCHQSEAKESQWSPDQPLRFTIDNVREISLLCYTCHPGVEKQVNLPFVHGPLGMGACSLCHDPHASKWPKLLENDATLLCANCHEMQDTLSQAFVHSVLKEKGCIACHNPHASTHRLQLNNTGNDLCLGCHDAIKRLGNNHPVQGHPVSIKSSNKKDRKDRLSCVSCHSPHATDFPMLIDEEEVMNLCTRCHDKGGK